MQTNDADLQAKEFYFRHCMTQSVLYASLLSPPLLFGRAILRGRPLNLNRLLRTNGALTFVGGGVTGAGLALAQTNSWSSRALHDKVNQIRHDGRQIAKQDHATVGAVLGTLITTTLLLKRASTINTIFGGASLGLAGGLTTYFIRSQSGRQEPKEVLGQVVPAAEELKEKAQDTLQGKK